MNLFDIHQEVISGKTVAHSVVKDGDDREQDHEESSDDPRGGSSGKIAEHQCEQYTANKDDSAYGPIFTADFVEELRPAFQSCDLFVELFQTGHTHNLCNLWIVNISLNLPFDQLKAKAADWDVTIEETRETPTSLLAFGVRADQRVVLKLSKYAGDESYSGKVLAAFAGDGAVKVYEYETGAVLVERLEPGEQLVKVVKSGDDEEATRILAQVIGKLANHTAPTECPTVADWGRGFDRYLESGDQQIPHELVQEARDLYHDLESTQRRTMLLHGDLQHYNVLFDNDRGWVAIDPKDIVGELEYEIGALLRNPVEDPKLFANPATINSRLETLTTLLHLDHSRTLAWSFAQAVLSAVWDVEDNYHVNANHHALLLAQALKPMLPKN
jgi:streptomycin 6-kinase